MDVSPRERDLLIRTVIGEAANEPDEGKAAVAHSVLNRVSDGRYGKGIEGVVFKPHQYEPWGTRSKELMSYTEDNPTYSKVANVVDNVITGNIKDPTNGATHFANVDVVKQRGNRSALGWISGMDNVSQIGHHTFGNADAGRTKMAKKENSDPLNGIDVNSLTSKYGSDEEKPSSPSAPSLEGIDVDTLTSKYGGEETKKTEAPNGWWQGLSDDNSWSGLAKRVGVGAVRGAKDVLDTGAHGLANAASYVADKVLPESLAAPIRQSAQETIANDKTANADFEKEYGNSTGASVGRVAGQVAGTGLAVAALAPAGVMGGIDAVAGAAPTLNAAGARVAAPLINRLGAAVGKGAVGGAEFGAATASSNDKSLAENVGEGALTGAVTGPLVTAVASGASNVGRRLVGGISQTRAALSQRAEQLGINLKATDVSNSTFLKKYDQMSGMLPFSGGHAGEENMHRQFTRAVSRTFGSDAEEITPQLINQSRRRIGQEMENIGARNDINADHQFAQDLHAVVNNIQHVGVDTEMRPVFRQIENILGKINANGQIDGATYKSLTNYKGVLSQAQASKNPTIAHAANQIREALDDALQRSIPQAERDALINARRQYKSVMTIKKLAEEDGEGQVSPLKLMQKVMNAPGGRLGSGELGELADIGRAFFKRPSDSGTPLGETILGGIHSAIRSPIGAFAAGGAAVQHGVGMIDMGLSAAALMANRGIRSAVNSGSLRDYVIRSAQGQTHSAANRLGNAVTPYSAALSPSDKQRLEVRPSNHVSDAKEFLKNSK